MVDNIAFTINLFGLQKDIYWYGIIIATGMLLGIWIATFNARRRGYKSEMVLDIALIAVIAAVIGARAHYVIFSWEYFKGGPFVDVFKIWNGGLAIYGGVIGGLIGVFVYSKLLKKRFLSMVDILVPSLILGQAIGRWGNFVNQEAYGWVINNPAWTFFPAAVFIKSEGAFHMATFFYESMWNFIAFIFLMNYMKKDRKEGNVFFLYFVLYGFGRMIIEGFRMDSQMFFGTGIRVNQLISVVVMIFGILMLLLRRNAPVVKSYKVKLFPDSEKKIKRLEEEEKLREFDISNVSDDLKLMDDEARLKRKAPKAEAEDNPSVPEETKTLSTDETQQPEEDQGKEETQEKGPEA